jgi:hypothetical protein
VSRGLGGGALQVHPWLAATVECRRFRRGMKEGRDRHEARVEALKSTQGKHARSMAALDHGADEVAPDATYSRCLTIAMPDESGRVDLTVSDSKSPREEDDGVPPPGGESVAMDAFDLTKAPTVLSLAHHSVDKASMEALTLALPFCVSLECVRLQGVAVSGESLALLRATLRCNGHNVKRVAIEYCTPWEGDDAEAWGHEVVRFASLPLSELSLRGCGLSASHAATVAAGLVLPTCVLQTLDMGGNALLQDAGARLLLAGVRENSSLTTLGLSRCGMTPRSLVSLFEACSRFSVDSSETLEREALAKKASELASLATSEGVEAEARANDSCAKLGGVRPEGGADGGKGGKDAKGKKDKGGKDAGGEVAVVLREPEKTGDWDVMWHAQDVAALYADSPPSWVTSWLGAREERLALGKEEPSRSSARAAAEPAEKAKGKPAKGKAPDPGAAEASSSPRGDTIGLVSGARQLSVVDLAGNCVGAKGIELLAQAFAPDWWITASKSETPECPPPTGVKALVLSSFNGLGGVVSGSDRTVVEASKARLGSGGVQCL